MTNSKNKAGLTLIEVVAAIALLASLLASILAAHSRLAKQMRNAEDRLHAVEAADRLLAEWTSFGPVEIPAEEGEIRGTTPLRWTVIGRSDPDLDSLGIQIAKLSIFSSSQKASDPPLASVEFLTTTVISGKRP